MNTLSLTATEARRDRVLLIAPHGSYRTAAFMDAARQLGLEIVIASQGEHSIVSDYAAGLHIDFQQPQQAVQRMLQAASSRPFSAVIATDDISTELAATVARQLGLPHNEPQAVKLTQRKDLARQCLRDNAVAVPEFDILSTTSPLSQQQIHIPYPAVLKPVALSGSRGVIRVDSDSELQQAFARVCAILDREKHLPEEQRHTLLLERFVPGHEVAVEGMLYNGKLHLLAVFDKPDPLDGPFFEETYYITPASLSAEIEQQLYQTVADSCRAYGLREGPIHAECRINEQGVWVLEVAARTIGGLCGRLLSLGTGYSLEQLVLLHAKGETPAISKMDGAAGVLMIPVPQAGILKRVEGLLQAQQVPYIEDVVIDIREGYELVPLPEGSSYLGFVFARAETAQQAEQALRQAHACLNFVVAPLWKINSTIS